MKARGANKAITRENKDKARELLKQVGIKPTIEVVILPAAAPPPPPQPEAPKPPPAQDYY
jgi:hypothetical protein